MSPVPVASLIKSAAAERWSAALKKEHYEDNAIMACLRISECEEDILEASNLEELQKELSINNEFRALTLLRFIKKHYIKKRRLEYPNEFCQELQLELMQCGFADTSSYQKIMETTKGNLNDILGSTEKEFIDIVVQHLPVLQGQRVLRWYRHRIVTHRPQKPDPIRLAPIILDEKSCHESIASEDENEPPLFSAEDLFLMMDNGSRPSSVADVHILIEKPLQNLRSATRITSNPNLVVHGHGVIATRLIKQGEIFFDPTAVLVARIQKGLTNTDFYIHTGSDENNFQVRARDESAAAYSYYVNEARKGATPNIEWSRGFSDRVMLSWKVLRDIQPNTEILTIYNFDQSNDIDHNLHLLPVSPMGQNCTVHSAHQNRRLCQTTLANTAKSTSVQQARANTTHNDDLDQNETISYNDVEDGEILSHADGSDGDYTENESDGETEVEPPKKSTKTLHNTCGKKDITIEGSSQISHQVSTKPPPDSKHSSMDTAEKVDTASSIPAASPTEVKAQEIQQIDITMAAQSSQDEQTVVEVLDDAIPSPALIQGSREESSPVKEPLTSSHLSVQLLPVQQNEHSEQQPLDVAAKQEEITTSSSRATERREKALQKISQASRVDEAISVLFIWGRRMSLPRKHVDELENRFLAWLKFDSVLPQQKVISARTTLKSVLNTNKRYLDSALPASLAIFDACLRYQRDQQDEEDRWYFSGEDIDGWASFFAHDIILLGLEALKSRQDEKRTVLDSRSFLEHLYQLLARFGPVKSDESQALIKSCRECIREVTSWTSSVFRPHEPVCFAKENNVVNVSFDIPRDGAPERYVRAKVIEEDMLPRAIERYVPRRREYEAIPRDRGRERSRIDSPHRGRSGSRSQSPVSRSRSPDAGLDHYSRRELSRDRRPRESSPPRQRYIRRERSRSPLSIQSDSHSHTRRAERFPRSRRRRSPSADRASSLDSILEERHRSSSRGRYLDEHRQSHKHIRERPPSASNDLKEESTTAAPAVASVDVMTYFKNIYDKDEIAIDMSSFL